MGKKDNPNILDKYVSFGKMNEKWDEIFNFTIKYFIYNKYSDFIINSIKKIKTNKIFFWILFIVASWYWSQLLLSLMYLLMLFDSIILSLLIIQNNSITSNSRRLSKNVILIALTSLNLIGGILSLITLMFIYMEWSKSINIIIFKIIKFVLKTIGNFCPWVYLMYPGIKLFSFDESDMTIKENSDSSSFKKIKKKIKKNETDNVYSYIDLDLKNKSSNSNSNSSSSTNIFSSESETQSETKSESKLILNSKSYFPTISSIKKNIKSKNSNKNKKNKNNKNIKKAKTNKKIKQDSSEPIGSEEIMILTKFGLNK